MLDLDPHARASPSHFQDDSFLRPEEEQLLDWIDRLEEREPFTFVGSQAHGEEAWSEWKNELRKRAVQVALPHVQLLEETVRSSIAATLGKLGKRVRFRSVGAEDARDLCIDPTSHEVLRSALVHLVRNSLVHGIESPMERQALGKSPEGVISLALRWNRGFVELELSDDGRGLQEEKIRQAALQAGIPQHESLPLEELIFFPQLSTRSGPERDQWAGSAVGLDAVRESLREQGGDVFAASGGSEGGLSICIRLRPRRLALSVVRLHAEVEGAGSRSFYLPLLAIGNQRERLNQNWDSVFDEILQSCQDQWFSFERFVRGPAGIADLSPETLAGSFVALNPKVSLATLEPEFRLFRRADRVWAARTPKGTPGSVHQLSLAPLLG